MTSVTVRCDAVPAQGRRAVLLAVGLATLLPVSRANAAMDNIGLAELTGADDTPSFLAKSFGSRTINVRGYLSPSLDGREFFLSEQPPLPCQLCGATHDLGATLSVRTMQAEPAAPVLQQVIVSGRLEKLPILQLVDAKIRAA